MAQNLLIQITKFTIQILLVDLHNIVMFDQVWTS